MSRTSSFPLAFFIYARASVSLLDGLLTHVSLQFPNVRVSRDDTVETRSDEDVEPSSTAIQWLSWWSDGWAWPEGSSGRLAPLSTSCRPSSQPGAETHSLATECTSIASKSPLTATCTRLISCTTLCQVVVNLGWRTCNGHYRKSLTFSSVSIFDNSVVTIGDRVLVGPGVYICTDTHAVDAHGRLEATGKSYAQPIRIDSDCWIGARAVILPGVHIGQGVTVAAGAVVKKDVEAGYLVGGVPAKVIRKLGDAA